MHYDYLTIGSTPSEEPCVCVGDADYRQRAKAESKRFIRQILRHYPMPNNCCDICIKAFPHDFGTYYEVCVYFAIADWDEDEPEASASSSWAFDIEGDVKGVLAHWDDNPVQLELELQ